MYSETQSDRFLPRPGSSIGIVREAILKFIEIHRFLPEIICSVIVNKLLRKTENCETLCVILRLISVLRHLSKWLLLQFHLKNLAEVKIDLILSG